MYDFNYQRPATVADAAAALSGAADGALLAGGQTLIPTLKQRLASPSDVIDLAGIAELKGISAEGGSIRIGAMTSHAEVASSSEVAGAIPALAALAGGIGDPHVRNAGTIGGSVANNDPAADYPAALVALGATVHTNSRQIAAADFFTGLFETALDDGEIVTAVSFPVPTKAGYAKFPNPASRYPIVGVMAAQTGGGARVAVVGAGPCVFRAGDIEAALAGNFSAAALDGVSVSAEGLNSDIHASAEFRAHLVTVMAKRAVAAAG
ncbi:MAG: xanthine dehydrogenase family protein subunit M [Alphaproteobacteria bacterium]